MSNKRNKIAVEHRYNGISANPAHCAQRISVGWALREPPAVTDREPVGGGRELLISAAVSHSRVLLP